jgi:hypothetical protein
MAISFYLAGMRKLRRVGIILVSLIVVFFILSLVLPKKQMAQLKMFITGENRRWLHKTNVVTVNDPYYSKKCELEMLTPVIHIDSIFHSMTGPTAAYYTTIEEGKPHLLWFTDYSIEVTDKTGSEILSKDFMCHNNLNFKVGEYLQHLGLSERRGTISERFMTLTEGQESVKFPEGFGIPIFSDNNIRVNAQGLNHNIYPISLDTRHRIKFGYVRNEDLKKPMKPLYKHALYIMVPIKRGSMLNEEACIQECAPPGLKNIRTMSDGTSYAGHWIIKQGRDTVKCDVTPLVELKENSTMHFANVHLHAYCESLTLRDVTTGTDVYTSYVKNLADRTGMDKIDYYSSEEGTMLYKDHKYELICITNNTSGKTQDMMAVMIIYTRDKELEDKIAQMKK